MNRQACFFTDAAALDCAIHAYVLMTNHVHQALDALGADRTDRTRAYREMFGPAELPAEIGAILRTTQGNFVLGSRRFAEEVAAMLGRRTMSGRRGRPAKPKQAIDLSGEDSR